jgi:hypothetical protein
MPYAYFALVKHEALCGRFMSSLTWFDWSNNSWKLPVTKTRGPGSGVRGPKTDLQDNRALPLIGDKYSLTVLKNLSCELYL